MNYTKIFLCFYQTKVFITTSDISRIYFNLPLQDCLEVTNDSNLSYHRPLALNLSFSPVALGIY